MATQVHASAVIEEGAKIGEGCQIGPFCHIGADVEIGPNCELKSHVSIAGKTRLGAGSLVFPFVALGGGAQHSVHQGDPCELIIGEQTIMREHVTMHLGTSIGHGKTTVGSGGYFMAGSHVAHDSIVGNNVVFTNNAVIGGHVEVGDGVIIGGNAAVHQFARIGPSAFVGGMAGLENDLIPFGMCTGNRANLSGLNLVGMKRRGIARADIHAVRGAYRTLFEGDAPLKERIEAVRSQFGSCAEVIQILDFIEAPSKRQICMPSSGKRAKQG